MLIKIAETDELYMWQYRDSYELLLEYSNKKYMNFKHSIYQKEIDRRVFPCLVVWQDNQEYADKQQLVLSQTMHTKLFEEPKKTKQKYKEDTSTGSLFVI